MDIALRVKNIVSAYNTRDPIRIAKMRGIDVDHYCLGDIKGVYKNILGNRFIGINSELDPFSQIVVAAHELGHDILHSSKQIRLMKDYILLPNSNKLETQANKFAAELLLNEFINLEQYDINDALGKSVLNKLIELKHSNIR